MFGSNLSFVDETGAFAGLFRGCLAGIHRLDKKIGDRNFDTIDENWGIFQHPIFLLSLWIPAEQLTNALSRHPVPILKNGSLPNIIGSRGRMNKTLEKMNQNF
jgi:hypothetical protein